MGLQENGTNIKIILVKYKCANWVWISHRILQISINAISSCGATWKVKYTRNIYYDCWSAADRLWWMLNRVTLMNVSTWLRHGWDNSVETCDCNGRWTFREYRHLNFRSFPMIDRLDAQRHVLMKYCTTNKIDLKRIPEFEHLYCTRKTLKPVTFSCNSILETFSPFWNSLHIYVVGTESLPRRKHRFCQLG